MPTTAHLPLVAECCRRTIERHADFWLLAGLTDYSFEESGSKGYRAAVDAMGRSGCEAATLADGELATAPIVGNRRFLRRRDGAWRGRRATHQAAETQEVLGFGLRAQAGDEDFLRRASEQHGECEHRLARVGIGAFARLAQALELTGSVADRSRRQVVTEPLHAQAHLRQAQHDAADAVELSIHDIYRASLRAELQA